MIHLFAEVHSDCRVPLSAHVWQFASVIREAWLGEHCSIGAGAIIDGAIVGDRCRIGAYAQIHPGTVLDEDVFVGPACIFCNDPYPSVEPGDWDLALVRQIVTVKACRGARIGAGAIVLPGVTLGERCFVDAGAVVRRSVPAGKMLKRSGEVVDFNTAWAKKRLRRAA